MSKRINGKVYWLIDVIYDDDMIYDIYENQSGERVIVPSGVMY